MAGVTVPARAPDGAAGAAHRFGLERLVRAAARVGGGLARIGPLRRAAVAGCERRLVARTGAAPGPGRNPAAVDADKRALSLALLHTVDRALAERRVAGASLRGLVRVLAHDVLLRRGDPRAKAAFRARRGCGPPDFLVISPGRACNLRCIGCYAASANQREKLPWPVLERVVREAHDGWGTRFFVISGGEPLAYRDEGRGVMDLAAAFPDCFFVMYTNGTLVDAAVARCLAALGNLSPALSLEGLRERTDGRRGDGVFDRVLRSMALLRRERVVFGLSLTATRENADEVLADPLVDLCFEEQGAFYAWIFHYMPMGRAPTLDLMPTPEQRLALWRRLQHLVRARRLFLADFWNSATVTNGCVAGGRSGGYLHVDWNGAVSPCVFVPYAPVNLRDVFARGGSLDDVWAQPLFADIRAWQREYGYRERGETPGRFGNWLVPCLIRDHHADFRRLLDRHRPSPTDAAAREALADPAYAEGLCAHGADMARLVDPIWRDDYLRTAAAPGAERRPPTAAS
jgi:MoaA/NifB/PqqE/SkfB family radical SAM enzyme